MEQKIRDLDNYKTAYQSLGSEAEELIRKNELNMEI